VLQWLRSIEISACDKHVVCGGVLHQSEVWNECKVWLTGEL